MPAADPILRPAADTPAVEANAMDDEQARAINRLLTRVTFAAHGLTDDAPSMDELRTISLSEMLEAKGLIEAANKVGGGNGKRTITMVCDDRLIAAIYVLAHYEPRNETIVELGDIGVAVLALAKDPPDAA